MALNPEVKNLPLRHTVAVRTRSTVEGLPAVLGEAWGRILGYLSQAGQAPNGPPYVAYFNMDMKDLDLEIGMPVASPLPGNDKILPSTLPAGDFAQLLHTGPYSGLRYAYGQLMAYLAAQKRQATATAWEFYLNDPAQNPPEQLQTLIAFQLK